MTDREKVLKGLDIHGRLGMYCSGCPYEQYHYRECADLLCKDAIALLKEQEPQKVIGRYANWDFELIGKCPKCNAVLREFDNTKACGVCGQAVKWDA